MRLAFLGAAGEVTGSGLLVEADGVRFVVDCGMFQGGRDTGTRNRVAYTRDLGRVDFVLLTHAHLDHSGLLPRFVANRDRRYTPPHVYCTRATADLLPVMLKDSAHIQNKPQHKPWRREMAPLYTADDVDRLVTRVVGVPYDVEFKPHPSVSVRLRSAGHIVGAAFAEIVVRDRGRERRLLVSGDLGEPSPLVVQERANPNAADVVVLESTYGDRNHRTRDATEAELIEVVGDVLHRRRGNLIVPAFALGRTQELLVLLFKLARAGRLHVPQIFVDSPLAREASRVTFAHMEVLDGEAHAFDRASRTGKLPFVLRYTESVEDSMFLNTVRGGAMIIAASGMCEAGRIRHHLRHNLPREQNGVLFTGFQAAGTLGRRLIDGVQRVSLFGVTVPVRASIHTLGGLSAHAGQDALVSWARALPQKPKSVFIVHGEPLAAHALSARLARELHWAPTIAAPDTRYDA